MTNRRLIRPMATRAGAMALAVGLVAWPADADAAFSLSQTFNDPTVTSGDEFGTSVAIDGNNVLIGAWRDDTNGTNVGQAHLFDTMGTLLRTFNDPTPTGGDEFGTSVAIDGGNVLIGAPFDDTNGTNEGQAHLFDAATGTLLQTFNDPTPTGADLFGTSVAIDGGNVLVGARNDATNGPGAGQAHLFDATTGTLLQTFDDPTPTSGDEFGTSVAIDGNNVLIGARLDDSNGTNVGQAHLFDAATGTLLQTFDDPTPTGLAGNGDGFGHSVAIDGNNVLIGALGDDSNGLNVGQAHLFDATTGTLLQTFDDPTITSIDRFGTSVAIDGGNVLIGADGDDSAGNGVGQAHLFTQPVPEPSSLALMLAGLLALGLLRRRT